MSTETTTPHPTVREHLRERAGPCKTWFKPKFVAEAIDATPTAVGQALAAMYHDPACTLVAERRSGSSSYVYRVDP